MKHKTIWFLSCLAAAVALAPMTLDAAPANETKEQREARQKLERENRSKYNDLYSKFNTLCAARKFADADPIVTEMLSMLGKPGVATHNQAWTQIRNPLTWGNDKVGLEILHRVYENILPKVTGDAKIDAIQSYSEFLQKNKKGTEEKIKALLAERYKVKDISSRKMVECLIFDGDLEKAEPVADKMIADEKDINKKISVLEWLAKRAFSNLKVYGSKYSNKYYKMLLNMEMEADRKVGMIQDYANFARQYAILSDEEIDKLLASRLTLKGLTNKGKISCICYDINQARYLGDSELLYSLWMKSVTMPKTDAERISLYNTLGNAFWDVQKHPKHPEIFEKYILADVDLYVRASSSHYYSSHLNGYNRFCRAGRFAEAEKFMNSLLVKSSVIVGQKLKDFKAAEKNIETLAATVDKLKADEDKTQDNAAKSKIRDQRNKVQNTLNEARREINPVKRSYDSARRVYIATCDGMKNMYVNEAQRYYEPADPATLKKAVAILDKQFAAYDDNETSSKLRVLVNIAKYSVQAGDYAKAEAAAAKAKELLGDSTNREFLAQYANTLVHQGLARYAQEKYQEVIDILLPIREIIDTGRDFKGEYYDALVRSYVALGQYKEALKYTDQMVMFAPGYMKNRLKSHVDELKERAAEAE